MSVRIEFSTNNAAFDDMEGEIKKILKHIIHKIDQGYLKDDIRDVNGNVIGEFEVN